MSPRPLHAVKPAASLTDLLANPKRVKSELERELAARRGAPGFLGLTARPRPQTLLSIVGDMIEVEVHKQSNAYRAGQRTGDLIQRIAVDGVTVPLTDFYERQFPVGTVVGTEFVRPSSAPGRRGMALSFKLGPWPRTRKWETQPRVACGAHVPPNRRLSFLAAMIPYLQEMVPTPREGARGARRTGWLVVYAYLSFVVTKRDNEGKGGFWGRLEDAAKNLQLSTRTINDCRQMLCHFGVLRRVAFPSRACNSNKYEITYPERTSRLPNRSRFRGRRSGAFASNRFLIFRGECGERWTR